MTDFTQQLDDYVAAHEAGDQRAVNMVFATIDDGQVDSFLEAVARRLPDASGLTPTTTGLADALQSDGLGPDQAAELSVLSTGTFREWVEHRMKTLGLGADTIVEDLSNDDRIDEETVDLAGEWLAAVRDGDTDPRELPEDAVAAIASALDASPRTVTSMAARQNGANR